MNPTNILVVLSGILLLLVLIVFLLKSKLAKGADPNKEGKLKMVGGIQVGDIEDYNAESAALTRMIQAAKFHLPVHFLMLAHVVRIETTTIKGRHYNY